MSGDHRNEEEHEAAGNGALPKDRELFESWASVRYQPDAGRQFAVQANSPSHDVYDRLVFAYDFFNEALFDGALPPCVLTLGRKKGTLGSFTASLFASTDGKTAHQINLNPSYFETLGDLKVCSTLVQVQCDLHRHEASALNRRGSKGSRGYHDRPWASQMLKVGLRPTSDGTWSGKMTGYRMTHLIVEGGPFDRAARALLESQFEFRWRDHRAPVGLSGSGPDEPDRESVPTRSKFTCPSCGLNAWAKHAARLVCGDCKRPLLAERNSSAAGGQP